MPFYQKQGKIPPKRHTAFKSNEGLIYYEELVSRDGFSSIYSNYYHLHRPTKITQVGDLEKIELKQAAKKHRHRHIFTSKIKNSGDVLRSRTPLFFNDDVIISVASINQSKEYFYRNGIADELLYIQSGSCTIISNLGNLEGQPGDYIVIRALLKHLLRTGTGLGSCRNIPHSVNEILAHPNYRIQLMNQVNS